MQQTAQQRFVELLREEPDVYVSQKRAEQLAHQAGYTDWPGFGRSTPPHAEPMAGMRVVTNGEQLPRVAVAELPHALRRTAKSRVG